MRQLGHGSAIQTQKYARFERAGLSQAITEGGIWNPEGAALTVPPTLPLDSRQSMAELGRIPAREQWAALATSERFDRLHGMAPLQLVPGGDDPHDSSRESLFIPRLGWKDAALLDDFGGFQTPLVAHPLGQAAMDRSLVSRAQRWQVGLVLDPQTWLNELPSDQRGSFRHLSISMDGQIDGKRSRLDLEQATEYASRCLEEQRSRGATVLLPPYHLAGGVTAAGRTRDLTLARVAIDLFEGQRLAESLLGEDHVKREIRVGIALDHNDLRSPTERAWLVAQYARLEASGYWVRVCDLDESSDLAEITAAASFLFSLQQLSGRPVVTVASGNLHLAFLAAGLGGASLGLGEAEHFSTKVRRAKGARRRAVYHPTVLRSLRATLDGSASDRRLRALFARFPCDCGHHPTGEPPSGSSLRRHTLSLRSRDGFDLGYGALGQRSKRAIARLGEADKAAASLGMDGAPRAAWQAVFEAGDEVSRRARG